MYSEITNQKEKIQTLYHLSHPQLRILYSEELYPHTCMQSVLTSFVLDGEFSIERLTSAIQLVIKHTDVLNLRIRKLGSEIKQYIHPFEKTKIDYWDFSEDEESLKSWIDNRTKDPLPIYDSCLYEFALYKNTESKICIFFKAHHIVKDGASRKILITQIIEAYKRLEQNLEYLPKEASYLKFLEGEGVYKTSPTFDKDRNFWLKKYQNFAPYTELFEGKVAQGNARSKRKVFAFTQEEIVAMNQCLTESDTSIFRLFMVNFRLFLAFTYTIFHRISDKNNIVIGAPLNSRSMPAYKEIAGMFVNMLPFHLVTNEESSFTELLNSIKTELKENISHQDYPYDVLIKDIRETFGQQSSSELFDLVLNYQNSSYPDVVQKVDWHHSKYDNYPLLINLREGAKGGNLVMEIDYRSSMFMDIEIDLLFLFYKQIIRTLIEDPSLKISSIDLYSDEVQHLLETSPALIPLANPSRSPILAYCTTRFFQKNVQSKKDLSLILHQKEKERIFWSDILQSHRLSFFQKNSSQRTGNQFDKYTFSLPDAVAKKLIQISNDSDQRLHIILSAGILLLFHKYASVDRLGIATTLFTQESYKDLVNTCLPIFCTITPGDSYKDILLKVIDNVNQAIEHQNYPIEYLLKQELNSLDAPKPENRTFEIKTYLSNIQKEEFPEYASSGLSFCFTRENQQINCKIDYANHVIDTKKIHQLQTNLDYIFKALTTDINSKIQDLKTPYFNRYSYCLAGENSVAASCAELLLNRNHTISCIISNNSSLQDFARKHRIPCLKPDDSDFRSFFERVNYDYFLNLEDQLHPLPFKLPGKVLKYHDSLLPQYAGFYATTRAILNEEIEHGITWYLTDEEEELREICKQHSFEISPQETSYSLNLKCISYVIDSFTELLDDLERDSLQTETIFIGQAQAYDKNCIPYAAGLLSFETKAAQISALVRSLNFENYDNLISTVKISIDNHLFIPKEIIVLPDRSMEEAGTILLIEPDHVVVATSTFDIQIRSYEPLTGTHKEKLLLYEGMNLQFPADKLAEIDQINRAISKHENFWVKNLSTVSPLSLGLPIHSEESGSTDEVAELSIDFPVLRPLYKEGENADIILLLFAAFLYRISSNSSFAIQYQDPQLLKLIGEYTQIFADYVPFKIQANSTMSFEDFKLQMFPQLRKVREAGSFQQDIFHRYGTLQSLYDGGQAFSTIKVTLADESTDILRFDPNVQLHLIIQTEKPQIRLLYSPQLIKKTTVAKLVQQFQNFVSDYINEPQVEISGLSIVSQQEKDQILLEFNDSTATFTENKTLNELFEQAVVSYGNRPAVAFQDRELSYQELNQLSNQTAHTLIKKGMQLGDHVAILTQRSIEMVIAIMAVTKAGGVYIPIDLGQPENRINQILASVQPSYAVVYEMNPDILLSLSLTNPYLTTILNLQEAEAVAYDPGLPIVSLAEILESSDQNPNSKSKSEDIAYVIHTSGSTGVPKGVIVKHRPVINIIEWVNQTYKVSPEDKLLFITSIGFDLSVYDIFGLLATGASIQIARKEEIQDPRLLAQLIVKYGITIWDSTPGTLNQLVPYLNEISEQWQGFRLAMLSGDWVPLSLPPALQQLFPNIHVLAMGGATEATIWSNYFDVGELDPEWKSVPYGKPIQNCKYYIFDKYMNVCPINVEGDLYIGGVCLAEGYLNKPELTHDRFIDNPYFLGQKIYKTGDRARWFVDGNMEFLGRVDHQIKLRGFRVELGEIESQMLKFPGVKNAIIIVKTLMDNDKRLIAYYTGTEPISPADLKAHVKACLPSYMVPAQLIQIDKIPITSIGKVDRKALMAIEDPQGKSESFEITTLSETGKQIVEIWQEALGVHNIGLEDNFFELGGHSFLVIQVSNMMESAFGKEPRFVNFTNRSLAEFISNYEQELI